ncbi:MAG: hypothetical protein ACRD2Y_10695 [Terriglobales bacterium]
MTRPADVRRSPTAGLLLGLIITVAAVVAYSSYIIVQISGLRKLQSQLADRSRKDSLQLLRIQNDLNALGMAMRDMLDSDEPYPLTAWQAQFDRIRTDLTDALRLEEQFAVVHRTPEQRQYLENSVVCAAGARPGGAGAQWFGIRRCSGRVSDSAADAPTFDPAAQSAARVAGVAVVAAGGLVYPFLRRETATVRL